LNSIPDIQQWVQRVPTRTVGSYAVRPIQPHPNTACISQDFDHIPSTPTPSNLCRPILIPKHGPNPWHFCNQTVWPMSFPYHYHQPIPSIHPLTVMVIIWVTVSTPKAVNESMCWMKTTLSLKNYPNSYAVSLQTLERIYGRMLRD